MLIKALCDYADKKTASQSEQTEDGFGKQNIDYEIHLSPEGKILEIVDIREAKIETDKKGKEKIIYKAKNLTLPKRKKVTAISSYYLEHRPLYIFGLNYDIKEKVFTPCDDKNKAKKSHEAFVQHELELLDGLDSEICCAYRNFIKNWNPEEETENPYLKQITKDYDKSGYTFSLGISKGNIYDDIQLKKRYIDIYSKETEEKNSEKTDVTVCGIFGKKLSAARIHDDIKFPGGNTTGSKLICMKTTAFESYGKTQSYNSNVSEEAMKKYTSAFNQLLEDKKHYVTIGDMVITYFAMKADDHEECSLFSSLMFNSEIDEAREEQISKLMLYAKSGYTSDDKLINNLEADTESTFYIAGFTPNSSRLCQKFIYRDKFGNLMKNLVKHQNDMQINENNNRPVYFWGIAKETISPKVSKDKVKDVMSKPLLSAVMIAAFNNTKYPDGLLSAIVTRVKVDSDDDNNHFIKLNDTRAGIIKACLNRKNKKEEITMAWNDENSNQAYLCGGLFAIYEKIQQDSSGGGLNRTIKDAYFASSCSRPASVFPKLAKLSQNHMRKLSEGACIYYNKMICDITNKLSGEFPSTLNLDDQGRFIIGYYQMNKKLFTSTKDNGKDDKNE